MEEPRSPCSATSIENRQRHLQRLVFKMQSMQVDREQRVAADEYFDEHGFLHSNVTVRGDASHSMSAISGDSHTVESRVKSPTILQEGDDSSFFTQGRRESFDDKSSPYSRSSSFGSRQGESSRHQEVKDAYDDESTRAEQGYRQPRRPSAHSQYENAIKARKDAVDLYSSVARKKASLMTAHNFESKNRNDKSNYSGGKPQSPRKTPPPLPFGADESQDDFVGKTFVPDDGSSVSSMTSMDSYMKQQYILREMERLRARDRTRPSRSSGNMHRSRRSSDSSRRWSSSLDEDRPERRSEGYRHERDRSKRTAPSKTRSRSMPRDRSRGRRSSDLESIWEQDSRSHSRSVSSRSRRYDNEVHFKNENYNKSTKTFNNCCQSHSTSHTPPLSQIEECCIKHPHILLSDQSDVNVWTCMRYCKDEKTGRWITKKKVCEACLEEDEESGYHQPPSRSHLDKTKENSYFDDRTHSMTSEDDFSSHHANRNTVNVYTDDGNQTPLEREAEAQRRRFIRRLAARAYHFPGNTWCEDWTQYIANTHIVFGIFFHHSLHPVTSRERCIILLGSVAVGLLMSNLIYLWFLHKNFGMNDVIIHIDPGLDITKLMITLWTLGSFVHTIFDLSVWHIKACTLCRYGGEVSDTAVKCGRRSGITIVMMTLAFATYLCLVRASQDAKAAMDETEENPTTDMGDTFFHPVTLAGSRKSFYFLLGYIIEFVLAAFVYSPVMLTIVFTGVLGCNGRIPVLGGRPREMAKEQRYAMKRQRYIMPRTLKLGDEEFEADLWGDEELMTKF